MIYCLLIQRLNVRVEDLNKERREALQEQQLIMADEPLHENEDARPLRDYVVPTVNGARSSIARPAVQANNFEIKLAII